MKGLRTVEVFAYLGFLAAILYGVIKMILYAIRKDWRKHP